MSMNFLEWLHEKKYKMKDFIHYKKMKDFIHYKIIEGTEGQFVITTEGHKGTEGRQVTFSLPV